MKKYSLLFFLMAAFFSGFARAVPQESDRRLIARPAPDPDAESIWWDGAYHMSIYQIGKLIDFDWWLWRAGKTLGIERWSGSHNVDPLGEVPDSTWFTNRIGLSNRPSIQEIMKNYLKKNGPSRKRPLKVISGKSSGLTPGFVVEDALGDKFVIKFDPSEFPELQSGAEIIGSRVLYAAGYPVPEYTLIYLSPDELTLAEGAQVQGKYKKKRPMQKKDIQEIFGKASRRNDGTYRAGASLYVPGEPIGPASYRGVRRDDANDKVLHEYRRELRALRVIFSLINNTDARRGNTLDTFIAGSSGKGYLMHYQLDFSASLGSGNVEPKPLRYGHEYVLDLPLVARSFWSAGFWVKPWEHQAFQPYRAAGTFEASYFDPEEWKPSYANPAFERMTAADAFWAAKIVSAFSDSDLEWIVSQAEYSDEGAARHVLKALIDRRKKIERAWMDTKKVNPLDFFSVRKGPGAIRVEFTDLAVERGSADGEKTRYLYELKGAEKILQETSIDFSLSELPERKARLAIRTSRDEGKSWGKKMFLHMEDVQGDAPKILKIER